MDDKRIAYYVVPGSGERWFVGAFPRRGGKDWGWVFNAHDAAHLSPYWQRRFRVWCEHMGRLPCFI